MLLGTEDSDNRNLLYHREAEDGLEVEAVIAAIIMPLQVEVDRAPVHQQGTRVQVSDPQAEDNHR